MKHLKSFNESIFDEDFPVEEEPISIELDSNLYVEDGQVVASENDPEGIENGQHWLEIMADNNIKHRVVTEDNINGLPLIELTAPIDNIKRVLYLWDAHGRGPDEVEDALVDWGGDEEELWEIIG